VWQDVDVEHVVDTAEDNAVYHSNVSLQRSRVRSPGR
jgi:hypothetical protein